MDFSEGYLSDISADALVGTDTDTANDVFMLYTMDDMGVGASAGLGFVCVGVGMCVSFGVAWVVSLLKRA